MKSGTETIENHLEILFSCMLSHRGVFVSMRMTADEEPCASLRFDM